MTGAPPAAPRLARTVGGSIFGTDVAGYHDARLAYPAAVYDAILGHRGTGGTVLEIGPGTGLATADILARLAPAAMWAVEADPALARHLTRAITDPRLTVVAQPFATAALAGPVDLACSAAAFHWLEPDTAFARLRTLLRPGGTLALWWNVYRQAGAGDAFADAVTPIVAALDLPPSEGPDGHYSLNVEHHRAAMTGAGLTGFTSHLIRRERVLTSGEVRALYASYSYVRALPVARRDAVLDAVEAIARERFEGRVPNLVLTPLYLADMPSA